MIIFNLKFKIMKILKNTTYEALTGKIKSLEIQNSSLKYDLEESRNIMAHGIKYRRFLIGRRGSGKTHFISRKLVTQIPNHFVFCIGQSDQYNYGFVDKKNKHIYDITLSPKDLVKDIIEVIRKNKDKVLIFDDYEIIGNAAGHTIFNELNNLNYVVAFHSQQYFDKFIFYADLVYSFGGAMDNGCIDRRTTVVNIVRD